MRRKDFRLFGGIYGTKILKRRRRLAESRPAIDTCGVTEPTSGSGRRFLPVTTTGDDSSSASREHARRLASGQGTLRGPENGQIFKILGFGVSRNGWD